MTDAPICPCDVFIHPRTIENPPGLEVIEYRLGDFLEFREALLRPLLDEIELLKWRPTAKRDLAVQMLEWWAYLADILTFYNERIANESYLRTALLPESVNRLIRVLGYRPRPGIGATGVIGALLSTAGPITIPKGFPIQSKPGPGKQPQIFELDADTKVGAPDLVEGDPAPDLAIKKSVTLKGTVSTVKSGDELLLLKKGWSGESSGHAFVTVESAAPEKDPRGNTNTRVTFKSEANLTGEKVTDYRLLRSSQSVGLWPYTSNADKTLIIARNSANATEDIANAASIVRQITPGTPVLIDVADFRRLINITSYSEIVWFANAEKSTQPEVGPQSSTVGVPIPHSVFTFTPGLSAQELDTVQNNIVRTTLRFAWNDVGELIGSPATAVSGSSFGLTVAPGSGYPKGLNAQPVLLEDGNLRGSTANATAAAGAPSIVLSNVATDLPLAPPLRLLFNLLGVSRGQTVTSEILGSGDATIPGQEFILQKSPLTYLQTTDPTYLEGYKSALRVWVDGIEWAEASSFFGQPAGARIFVTREDENSKTHVQFGDGINGARLSSGINNVVAQYKYGSGADVPAPGQLTVMTQPFPGLKSIENPVAPGGGANPDSPQRVRQLAPRSILTFGRAVSGDDYEVIAAQTPGVARARAYWAFDGVRQRTVVTVYVGDDASAVTAAKTALARSADPNRPVVVTQAIPIHLRLDFTLVIDPAYQVPAVVNGVRRALIDADAGLFGLNTVRIGASVFQSQIEDACLRVPGALAVHSLIFVVASVPGLPIIDPSSRHFPGEGRFYQLQAADLRISTELAAHAL
jgi:hypothetical protein